MASSDLGKGKRFSLAVLGEVKSGKSSFLNALIREEALPSDVLQSTSAIIEVFYASVPFVEVTFGDGRKIREFDDLSTPQINEAIEFLRIIGCVPDSMRHLPTNQLNRILMNAKRDCIFLKQPRDIDKLISEIEIENIYSLESETFLQAIKTYLWEHRDLARIPVKVAFGTPQMSENINLTIIDTPGVNAVGGIQDETLNYMIFADLIMFIHPLKPIESKTLKEFIESMIGKVRTKNVLFALTHASHFSEEEVQRILDEAKMIYEGIPKENFFVIDSLIEILVGKLSGLSDERIEELLFNNEIYSQLFLPHFSRCGKNVKRFLKEAEEKSGFKKIRKVLKELTANGN